MPRSPSRDLADRFAGNRGYFHRSDRIRRGKYVLAGVAFLLAVGWVVADAAAPARVAYSHTHGPLANPHAAWDDNCTACHREHSFSEIGVQSVFQARDRWHDLTCEKCHKGAPHNASVAVTEQGIHERCSNCHHDHGGRTNSLVRISDSHCTQCHADLAPRHATGSPLRTARITGFVSDHPEFRLLTSPLPPDRALKFSHALHMTPGIRKSDDEKWPKTISWLRDKAKADPSAVARYRRPGQGDSELIALECASCHRLDSGVGTDEHEKLKAALNAAGEPTRSVFPARPAGAHFLPVNFELHCRACHPLRAGEGAGETRGVAGFDVPHRKPVTDLKLVLTAGYVRSLVAINRPALAAPAEPGGWLDPRHEIAARTIREEADRLTATAMERFLSVKTNLASDRTEGCVKCHDLTKLGIAPIPDRTVWFKAAKFNHLAHRAATCLTCHPGTAAGYAPSDQFPAEKEPVQILGIDSCRACHSPAGTRVTLPDGAILKGGGIRHSCVDCHRYHNGDHGVQGRGAPVLFPASPLSLSEFLRGKKD